MHETDRENLYSLLKGTSRSFYLGIMGLKTPTRDYICLGYLFCRLMDSFEDASTAAPEARLKLLAGLRKLLSQLKADRNTLDDLLNEYLKLKNELGSELLPYFSQHPKELDLFNSSESLLGNIIGTPLSIRSCFAESLLDMALGMEEEIKNSPFSTNRETRSFQNFEQYCYIVAGTVGIFLTRIFWNDSIFKPAQTLNKLEELGEAFGKALQIVNITKDFHKDWNEGRCFWPDILPPGGVGTLAPKADELFPTLHRLNKTFLKYKDLADQYIESIKGDQNEALFFCSFPLLMAEKTMSQAMSQLDWLSQGNAPKVSKEDTVRLVQQLTLKYALPRIL